MSGFTFFSSYNIIETDAVISYSTLITLYQRHRAGIYVCIHTCFYKFVCVLLHIHKRITNQSSQRKLHEQQGNCFTDIVCSE